MAQTRPTPAPSKTAKPSTKHPAKADVKAPSKPGAKSDVNAAVKPTIKVPETQSMPKIEVKAKDMKSSTKIAVADSKHDRKPEMKPEMKTEKVEKLKVREEPMTSPKIANAEPVAEKPSVQSSMGKAQLKKFRGLLEEKRDDIIKKAKQTLDEDMTLDSNDLPDEMDLASSEYLQSFTFRLRGREKTFLDKIQKALDRIDEGGFGVCEECGDEISVKRLEARPETTLCIRCKEDQERAEKDFG